MTMKSLLFASLALLSSTGLAAAQSADPRILETLGQHASVKPGVSPSATAPANGSVSNLSNPNAPVATGWHFGHAINCGYFLDSSNREWFYIFTESETVFGINDIYIGVGLAPPCAEGNWVAWFVVNSSTGAFNQTLSYSFK